MKIWFIYDNFAFAEVGDDQTPTSIMRKRLVDLFAEDGCGSVGIHNARGSVTGTMLHGHPLTGESRGWGVTASEIDAFLERAEELSNWEARG